MTLQPDCTPLYDPALFTSETFSLRLSLTISSRAASPLSRLRQTMITVAPPAARAFAADFTDAVIGAGYQTDFLIHSFIFHIRCDICHK
jgi:hypothetical protein